jgi:cytochrome b
MNPQVTWNLFTRITHWLIAIPIFLDFFLEGGDAPHKVMGYLALGATLVRFIWGFITNDQARFLFFPLGLKSSFEYLSALFSANPIKYPGHNPLASWVYILMWILAIALGITGYMMGLDAYWGESWLEELHASLSNGLQLLVILHIAGILFDSWKFKRKTWMGMISGKKN